MQFLYVRDILSTLLSYIDSRSVHAFLIAIQVDSEMRSYFHDHALWSSLLRVHFGEDDVPLHVIKYVGAVDPPVVHMGLHAAKLAPCVALRDFLRSARDMQRFDARIHVIKGSIRTVSNVNHTPLDAIAFSTNPYLTNHFIGAAGAVFARAGQGLRLYLRKFSRRQEFGAVVATPSFDANVKMLLHCVGPGVFHPKCNQMLRRTYENLTVKILRERLQCVAMTSISTGAMGVDPQVGARVALRVLVDFVRVNDQWDGQIGIVCVDDDVYEAFVHHKKELLATFNS